jgi:hypothetical protein
MRPKIMTSRSIARSLCYNEEKVRLGKAECIAAANFLKDLSRMTPEDKLHHFQRRMDLNDRVRTSQHITLNFDPSDTLSNGQMKQIANLYMKEIGFERQPYVVYRHNDAGHPHCHIVTTHIRRDGSPIDLYNVGRNQSEKAKQLIENEFGLITAEMKRQVREEKEKIDGVPRIQYGEKAISRSISQVLEYVTENYYCTSLPDLNALLRLYNLEAYRGKEQSKLYQHRGLLYRVLDDNGKYIGVPLKASFFDCKPTLANLEKKFEQNLSQKIESRHYASIRIKWQLFQNSQNLQQASKKLAQDGIEMVLRQDKNGNCKEVTYVDFESRCVFSGSELGEECDANAIRQVQERQKAYELADHTQELKQIQKRRHSLHH